MKNTTHPGAVTMWFPSLSIALRSLACEGEGMPKAGVSLAVWARVGPP